MILDRKKEITKILSDLKITLEKKDFELFKNRNKKYVPVKTEKRTVTTELGQLNFKRRIYKHYNENTKKYEYIALLDQEIGLKKWQKLDDTLVEKIRKELRTGKRYQDIVEMFSEAHLSRMTICNIFKRINYRDFLKEKPRKIKIEAGQIIYINIDDTFPNVRKKKKNFKLRVRVVSFHLGYDRKKTTAKRNVLLAKRFFFALSQKEFSTKQIALKILREGRKFFEGFENAKLVLGGDGAPWIKNLAEWIRAEYVLDKYHAFKYLRDIFKINFRFPKRNLTNYFLYKTCASYFQCGNYQDLLKIVEIYGDKPHLYFFRNNKKGIESYGKPWNIGVSAESDVSKLVKSSLGYGSRTYSFQVFRNILYSRVNFFNDIF